MKKKIVVIEPYYGGSHRSFLRSIKKHLPYDFSTHTLPARKWKWRMRMAAPFYGMHFAANPAELLDASLIFCSPFLDVAVFKGLLPVPLREIPVFTYFHENQFAYPVQVNDERDFHFALTNLSTALASDRIAFNSAYNLNSFLAGAEKLLKLNYDMNLPGYRESILAKATILHPPLELSEIDAIGPEKRHGPPVIVWNHRWEHDKNPQLFFETLYALHDKGHNFRLIIMGESFRRVPEIFSEAKEKLAEQIIHFGYVESRQKYLRLLHTGDIVISTANHEFYGISVIEAVRAGCRPLLPNRLSYPELFPREFLYDDAKLFDTLAALLLEHEFSASRGKNLTSQYSWESLQRAYESWFTPRTFPQGTHSPLG